MNLLKQSTSATIKLGVFVDDTDGKTAETGLTISQADIKLSKNGGTLTQSNNTAGATHDALGYYSVPLDSTDTNTLGRLLVAVSKSGALPVWQEFLIVKANVYDTLCSTDKLDVNVAEVSDDSTAADNLELMFDGTGYAGGSTKLDVNAATIAADAVAEIQNGLALEATLTAIKGTGWDENSSLKLIQEYAAGNNSLLYGDMYDAIIAILADSNELQTDLVNGGRLDLLIDSIIAHLTDIKGAGWTSNLDNLKQIKYGIDSTYGLVEDGGAIDLLIDAIKAKTDNLPADPADDSDIDTAIAAVKSVVDDILVDTGTTLDTLIKDIPTNAELTTALGTADDAVLAAVAAAKVVIDDIHDTDLPAIKAETALIVEDTGTTLPATLATLAGYTDGIAGDVWSSPIRTLTVPAVAAAATEDGTTLTLYKDADINIEFTGLTIPTGAKKVVFTIKDNLDDADTAAALQATYQLTAVPAETHTLNYINSAVPPVLTTPVTFTVDTDSVEFDMTAAAAYYLPRYERGYLHWDLKLITDTTVQILQQGLVQILGTSTRAVA